MTTIIHTLRQKWFLLTLLIVNVLGTIYGYVWYGEQLRETPVLLMIFVPDSPTASFFFVFVLIAFLIRKTWPILEALALITLLKYGIWAVTMNLLVLHLTSELSWQGYMLIVSHGAMAVQGLLYLPYYKLKVWHLAVAALWTLHNDIIDYLFHVMPRYGVLDLYMAPIGYFTFWLSIASIGVSYLLTIRRNRMKNL